MKFAFLPHYFKKVGIAGLFVFIAIIVATSIIATIQALQHGTPPLGGGFTEGYQYGTEWGKATMLKNWWIVRLCSTLMLLSIACHMLAKEKIEDEYMDVIRWESLRLSLVISIGLTIAGILFSITMQAKLLLIIQYIIYLVIFKIKKSRSLKNT